MNVGGCALILRDLVGKGGLWVSQSVLALNSSSASFEQSFEDIGQVT